MCRQEVEMTIINCFRKSGFMKEVADEIELDKALSQKTDMKFKV